MISVKNFYLGRPICSKSAIYPHLNKIITLIILGLLFSMVGLNAMANVYNNSDYYPRNSSYNPYAAYGAWPPANNNHYPYPQVGSYQPPQQVNIPQKVLFLYAGHTSTAKAKLLGDLAKKIGIEIKYQSQKVLKNAQQLTQLSEDYGLLIFDTVNANEAKKNFLSLAESIEQLPTKIKTLAIRWPTGDALRKGINEKQAERLLDYYGNGGEENFKNFLAYIKQHILATKPLSISSYEKTQIAAPIIYPSMGIYHPDYSGRIFADPEKYLAWHKKQILGQDSTRQVSVVGITLHQETLASENMAVHDAMIRQIEQSGATPLVFYYRAARQAVDYVSWLSPADKLLLDVVINTRLVHWAEKRLKEFEKMGVTVLHGMASSQEQQEWREDNAGVPAHLVPFYLTLSEMAGLADPIMLSAKDKTDGKNKPISEQLDLMVRKALRIAELKSKPNTQKKVAIVYYNYPPGEKNASASFLNIPRSVKQIIAAMKQRKYAVTAMKEQDMIDAVAAMQRPFYRQEPAANLLKYDMADSLPLSDYMRWFETLPEQVQQDIYDSWGKPENHYMTANINGARHFIIPRYQNGNIIILPQPPRGDKGEREKSIYHSKSLAINHYYLAVYLYLRKTFKTDALVHLGTHGSHEWLPGKERGLWAYDPGNLSADDIPVIYPYIVDDVGEALQAKRRGRAVMISHMTPPFAPSGLYRELSEVHELMHQYTEVDPGLVKKRTRKQLINKLESMNIIADMGWQINKVKQNFSQFMLELHDYLHDLASINQPLGLHSWGQVSEDRLLIATIMQVLGSEFADAIAAYQGESSSVAIPIAGNADHQHSQADSLALLKDQSQLEDLPGFSLLNQVLILNQAIPDRVPDDLRKLLIRAEEILAMIRGNQEMSALFTALAGGFVPPSSGGDPIRNTDSLPTGRNLYGFDPSRVPTPAAWESGKQLVETMIIEYYQKHGKYPDKMAFSLWSIETMRHYGVLESQALYAMGIRPVWSESGRVTGTEIIPYAELKRPRVDVVLSATGLYRDAFPNVMQLIATGIDQVAKLKEPSNFVYRHTQGLKQALLQQGKTQQDAEYFSTIRIFSGSSGSYGTGLNAAILASDSWENDKRLADMYMDRMGYGFGADSRRWGEKIDGLNLYGKNLSGTDMALFSRSSNLYGLLTSDDPFQYLGGISLAVRNLDGKDPEMYISNLRNPNQEKIQSLNTFMSQELRSRYFHPRWIKQMQKEDYAGTLSVVETLNNFWGWQVVDPQNIRADQWQEFFEVYVQDKYQMDMQEWFEENNPEALAQIAERMLEAIRKEYWNADENTIKKLTQTYIELQQQYDIQSINQKFNEYVKQQAIGFGLNMNAMTKAQMAVKAESTGQKKLIQEQAMQQVQGQQMEKVEAQPDEDKTTLLQMLAVIMSLVIIAGILWQFWKDEIMFFLKALVAKNFQKTPTQL